MSEPEERNRYQVPAWLWHKAMRRSNDFRKFLARATFTIGEGKINGLEYYRKFVKNAKPNDPITIKWRDDGNEDVMKAVGELVQPGGTVEFQKELADLQDERRQIQQRVKELNKELADLEREIRDEVFSNPIVAGELMLGVGQWVRLILGAVLERRLLLATWKVDREA